MESATKLNQDLSILAVPAKDKGTATPRRFHELLIRDDPALDDQIASAKENVHIIQRFVWLSILGCVLFGLSVGLAAQFFEVTGDMGRWLGAYPLVTLPIAFTGAFFLALCVCLPSFYFYTQISGIDASFRMVTAQALRIQARTSVLLLGALPIYVAVALAAVVGLIDAGNGIIFFGIVLPFVVGLLGLVSLYRSFGRLSETLPTSHKRRPRFLPRMVMAWGAVYTAVCPVALYRIVEALGQTF